MLGKNQLKRAKDSNETNKHIPEYILFRGEYS